MERHRSYYIFALMKYIEGFRWYLVASTITKLLVKIMPIVIAVLISYTVSSAILRDARQIVWFAIAIIVAVLLTALFSFLDTYVSHDMAFRILTKLRNKAYDKLDEVAPASTEGKQSGDFVSTIMNDIEFFEWFYAHILIEWLVVFIISTSALIFMGSFSLFLPVLILPFAVFIVSVPRFYAKKADRQGGNVRMLAWQLNSEVVTGVQGIKDIISYGWQKNYFTRFTTATERFNAAEVEYAERSAYEKRLISSAVEFASVSASVLIAVLVINGSISALWLMPLFMTALAIFSPLQDAMALSTNYGYVYGAAKHVFELLQLKPLVEDKGNLSASDVLPNPLSCTIAFDSVQFAYPLKKTGEYIKNVLDGTSFTISNGETVALVSASGGGKTTIARLLQRFWDVDDGSIKINDVDIRNIMIQELRDIVTVVPQDIYLFNESVLDNLRLAKVNATIDEIKKSCKYAQADSFINALPNGYDTLIGERGLRLSGGEKQRLSIAQAFLKNSPVLVLDEASASLDATNESLINESIEKLKKGRATIIIAHRLSTIKRADRVVLLKGGKVEGSGTFDQLLQSNSYFRDLVGSEFA